MDDLVQWLREQIAERLRMAREHARVLAEADRRTGPATNDQAIAVAAFMYGYNPKDEIAQCDAHTAILDRYEHERQRFDSELLRLEALEDAVRAAGLAYQHRPGYREEWRP